MTLHLEDVEFFVPAWVGDIDSFRQWTEEPDFPEAGNIWWLCGEVWADMSKEQVFTHVGVKGAIFAELFAITKKARLGRMFTDGILLSNFEADISGNPDAMFLSKDTLASDRVRLIEGARGGCTEIQGSPDMVLEVVSDSSETKDLKILRRAYWRAGVSEYWVVDARKRIVKFDVFRRGPRGFVRTTPNGGWIMSEVFGRSFRFVRTPGADPPDFDLNVQ